jgi:hypothetical protein
MIVPKKTMARSSKTVVVSVHLFAVVGLTSGEDEVAFFA